MINITIYWKPFKDLSIDHKELTKVTLSNLFVGIKKATITAALFDANPRILYADEIKSVYFEPDSFEKLINRINLYNGK